MPTANEWTLAIHRAKRDVKLDLRSKGEKVSLYSAAEIYWLAQEWLKAHPELIEG